MGGSSSYGRRAMVAGVATLALALVGASGTGAQSFGTPPEGANDFDCRPSAVHPSPVILLHGTYGDMTVTFVDGAPLLAELGYCVFALDYGDRASGPMDASADQIAEFTRLVMAETGARTVSYVGHSQGGMIGRHVARFKGLSKRIEDIVGLAPSNHGTTTPLAPAVGPFCAACEEQVAGSPFYERLNAGDESPPPTSYTNVVTRYDEVVTPYTSGELAGGPNEVTNVTLQDACPANSADHAAIGVPGDPVAFQWAVDALSRPGPANRRFEPDCSGAGLGSDPDPYGRLVGKRLRTRDGAARVPVRCFGPARTRCSSRITLRRRGRSVGAARAEVPAGERQRVPVTLVDFDAAGGSAGKRAVRLSVRLSVPRARGTSRRYPLR